MSDTSPTPTPETLDEKIERLRQDADALKERAQRDGILSDEDTDGVGAPTGLVP